MHLINYDNFPFKTLDMGHKHFNYLAMMPTDHIYTMGISCAASTVDARLIV